MKMLTNYLNSLESYLPEDMQKEVREELEASILGQVEDKQEVLGRELTLQEQENLLYKIGHPMRVASAYLPNQELVNKAFYPAYKKSIELALLIVFSIKILIALPSLMTSEHLFSASFTVLFGLFETGIWVFAYVTLAFYLMQKYHFKLDYLYSWSPKDIRENSPKLSLSRVQVFFEMAFSILFLTWWNNIFNLPVENMPDQLFSKVSLSAEWTSVYWSVNIIIGLSLFNSFYTLFLAGWNKITLTSDIILNLATVLVLFHIASFDQFVTINKLEFPNIDWDKALPIIDINIIALLGFIFVVTVWDTYSNVRKLIKE